MNKKTINRKVIYNYILTFLLIAISGFYFFRGYPLLVCAFFVSLILFIARKKKVDKFFIFYIGIFIFLILIQTMFFNFFSAFTIAGLFIRLLTGFFMIKLIGKNFPKYYVNIMYIFAIISFIFYIPILLSPDVENYLSQEISPIFKFAVPGANLEDAHPSLVVYTINTGRQHNDLFVKNSGPLWEPAAFGGFLLLALIFNTIKVHNFFDKKNILFLVAILTTFSTTAYITTGMFIIFYLMFITKSKWRYFLAATCLLIFILLFFTLSFLNEKILFQYNEFKEGGNVLDEKETRFVSIALDYKNLKTYPIFSSIFGRGPNDKTRFDYNETNFNRHCGITDFLVKYGLIGLLLYFGSMYFSFRKMCESANMLLYFSFFVIIIIFIMGISEVYFYYPMFWSLSLMHIVFPNVNSKGVLNEQNERKI